MIEIEIIIPGGKCLLFISLNHIVSIGRYRITMWSDHMQQTYVLCVDQPMITTYSLSGDNKFEVASVSTILEVSQDTADKLIQELTGKAGFSS